MINIGSINKMQGCQDLPAELAGWRLAGVEGLEPSVADLESAGLPLTDTPKFLTNKLTAC